MGDDLQRKPQVGCNENRGLSSYSLFKGIEEFEKNILEEETLYDPSNNDCIYN